MSIAVVTSKGQITVPKAIRDDLGLKPGDRLEFVKDVTGETVVRRRPARRMVDLFGTLPEGVVPASDESIDEAIGDAAARRSA